MKRLLVEVANLLIALEIVLAYLCTISLFKPEYVILSRGIVWGRVYSIVSTYETLILLVVALAISVCVYAVGGFRAVKLAEVSVYVLAILTVVYGLPLAYWIAYIWNPQFSQDHSLIRLSELDAGIYLFKPEVFEYMPEKGDLEATVFPKMAEEEKLKAVLYKDYGFWKSIDTHKDVDEAERLLTKGGGRLGQC
jgi:hypothetical protein